MPWCDRNEDVGEARGVHPAKCGEPGKGIRHVGRATGGAPGCDHGKVVGEARGISTVEFGEHDVGLRHAGYTLRDLKDLLSFEEVSSAELKYQEFDM